MEGKAEALISSCPLKGLGWASGRWWKLKGYHLKEVFFDPFISKIVPFLPVALEGIMLVGSPWSFLPESCAQAAS